MYTVTLTIAIITSLLVLVLRPIHALAAYIIMLLWYPSYLVVNVGTLDISAARIVITVLLLRCLFNRNIRRKFTWSRLDTWVTLTMIVYITVFCITRPLSIALENRSGSLMDTWFVYIVVRLCVTDLKVLKTLVKCIGIALAPLAILGIIESVTAWQPYLSFTQYCPWMPPEIRACNPRTGLYRAVGPFGHPIMFGAAFILFLPLIYSLRHEKNWQTPAYILSGAAILGSLSSMSSGPVMMAIVAVLCIALERQKKMVKPLLLFFVISCVGIGIISNRPFYHVIVSYANPIGGAWWHRCKLIDCAISSFGEWFLLGYKGQDPGWGSSVGMAFTDVTNQFILNGVQFGVFGIIALVAILISGFRGLMLTYKRSKDRELRSFCWAMGAILVCLITVWISVSFFGQTSNLTYCILGIIGSVSTWQTGELQLQNK